MLRRSLACSVDTLGDFAQLSHSPNFQVHIMIEERLENIEAKLTF
jgi:hypothetical protein